MKFYFIAILIGLLFCLGCGPKIDAKQEHVKEVRTYMDSVASVASTGNINALSKKVDFSKIQARPRHGCSPERLVEILQQINLENSEIIITPIENGKCLMRVKGDFNFDFELELRGEEYVLVGVHT